MVDTTENIIDDVVVDANETSFIKSIIDEILYSPVNVLLVSLIAFLIYKIIKSRSDNGMPNIPIEPELPKLRKDFTVVELKQYDGNQPDGRVLVAVNGHVYDVTKGKKFYGPGGPYAAFGGRDASRGLATFNVTSSGTEEYDDLSDLETMEMESVREWEMQFKEKYEYVGRLLRPGEQANSYSDEEDDTPPGTESNNKNKEFPDTQTVRDIKNIDSTEAPENPKAE